MPNTNFQTIHQMGQAINEVVRQATGRDAVQNIDMDHVTVAQNKYYEEITVSGSVVSFTDNVGGMPLEKCVVQIEPVQDLHGYDHPWAGGAGKNLFGGFPQDPGTALKYFSLNVGNGTFTMSTTMPFQPGSTATNLFILPGQVETGASSASNGVSIGIPRTVDSLDGYITIAYRNANNIDPTNYDIQLEAGSNATAYEPYSNICPITGWTGANIHVSPTTDAQDGTTYSITFPDEAGTVYGGTLTVNADGSGTLVVDRQMSQLSSFNWIYEPSNLGFICAATNIKHDINSEVISSIFAWSTAIKPNMPDNSIRINSANTGGLFIKTLNISSTSDLETLIAGQTVVFPLETPVTYTLTAEQIETLQGANNIWADTGDIEVTYKVLRGLY